MEVSTSEVRRREETVGLRSLTQAAWSPILALVLNDYATLGKLLSLCASVYQL